MKRESLYYHLLHDEEKLRALWQASSLNEFVTKISQYLEWPNVSFEQLLEFLHAQNRQPICPELEIFSRCWQPSAYQRQQKIIRWIPAFIKPSKPFFEDDISHCRAHLLAQLIQPVSLVNDLLPQKESLPSIQPKLLIFHWSRCGSTLLARSFMLQPECKVLSESMLISDLLSDQFFESKQDDVLDLAIRLQGRFRHNEEALIIKCNAWDLQYSDIWLRVFPSVNIVCLVRKPEDILASHHNLAGRHMVNQTPHVWPVTWQYSSILEFQINVIALMASYTNKLLHKQQFTLLDYEQLVDQSPSDIAALAGIQLTSRQEDLWRNNKEYDAKNPSVKFNKKTKTATDIFPLDQINLIRHELTDCYEQLLSHCSS